MKNTEKNLCFQEKKKKKTPHTFQYSVYKAEEMGFNSFGSSAPDFAVGWGELEVGPRG